MSGRSAEHGTGAAAEAAYWADCWCVDEGDAGNLAEGTSEAERDAPGRRCHPCRLWRSAWARFAWGETGSTAGGTALG